MKKNALVSIIIVNWNGGEIFKECLKSLKKITYSNWELIIVDNGSTDGSDTYHNAVKLPAKRVLTIRNKENVGFAPANNQAVKKAKGSYVLLLNNDTRVTPLFLSKLVQRMDTDLSIGVIQPKIYMMDPPADGQATPSPKKTKNLRSVRYLDNAGSFMTWTGFLEHWGFGEKDSKEFDSEREVFSCKGACMLTRMGLIKKIGLFDDTFVSYFEESDYCWRVWLVGSKVLFYPDAHIYHKVGFTIKRLDVTKINFDYYKNRISSLIKNLGFANVLFIVPIHIVFSIGIACVFIVRGQSKGAMMIFKAIKWNVVHIKSLLVKRKEIQNLRIVSDHVIFTELMHSANIIKFFGAFERVEKDMR